MRVTRTRTRATYDPYARLRLDPNAGYATIPTRAYGYDPNAGYDPYATGYEGYEDPYASYYDPYGSA